MGQRANYIVIDNSKVTIHYNHWRANRISSDLYLGEKRFLKFVNECQIKDELLSEPWIESCVIIDTSSKHLYFWSYESTTCDTSIINYYLKQLSEKWEGWEITLLKNRMYDIEKILGIDYISKQEPSSFSIPTKENILSETNEDWLSTLIIIKSKSELFITKATDYSHEKIILFGEEIIPDLKAKKQYELPIEKEEIYPCLIIDLDTKKIIINESIFQLPEYSKRLWPEYDFTMGDFGYLEALQLAGIDTKNREMPLETIIRKFEIMVNNDNDNFNPFELAERIIPGKENVQFNTDFFDNVKPKKSFTQIIKGIFKK